MAIVDELVTILGLKLAPDALSKLKSFKDGVSSVTKTVAGLGLAVTGLTAAAGVFIKGVVDEAAELDKLSQKTGISTTALQEWGYAAQKSGLDAKAIQSDIVSLQKTMSSPIPGQFNHTLAMFGVSARNSSGELKTTDQLLAGMADKFQGMSQQKAAQWASKLGISDDTLLLLRKGREGLEELRQEAHKLGGIIPEDSIKRAAEFKKQVAELTFALRGITSQVALATLPALSKLVDTFKGFIESNREWIALGLGALMDGIVAGFERFFGVVKKIFERFSPLTDAIKEFLPEMEASEVVTHLVTGALTGLLFILSPIIAKFALIGAAVVLAMAVFEDFFTYLEGGDSVIGHLFNSFEERWPDLFAALKQVGTFLYDFLIKRLEDAWEAIKYVGEAFAEIGALILDNLNTIAGPIADFFKTFDEKFPALSKMLSAFAELVGGVLKAAFDAVVSAIKVVINAIFKVLDVIGGAVKKVAGFLDWAASKLGFGDESDEKMAAERQRLEELTTTVQQAEQGTSAAVGGGIPQAAASHQPTYTAKPAPGAAVSSQTYIDNRTVTIQVASNDPVQAGNQAYERFSDHNVNTPGQYASVAQ